MTRQIEPQRAVERYLNERRADISESTYYNHSSLLSQFIEWCDNEGLDYVNELDGFHISDFKIHRRDEDGINKVTLYNQMTVLRVFLRWCESRSLVEGLAENILMPVPEDDSRDTMIDSETAAQILQYLQKYEHGTLKHTVFSLLWDTGFRVGTLRAIDLEDYHSGEQFIEVEHRAETGTPLKNKYGAEREVNLHEWVCDVIDDYVEMYRHDVTDDHGRKPLITTEQGRPVRSNIRGHINSMTRPCVHADNCPHGRDPDSCEAAQRRDAAARCPGSVPPHAIRRSAITAWLNDGHTKELLSDRMNVSVKTLEKHYDARTESEKRELRREEFGME
ncbi:integrase [Halorubrum persicum]|uniref:Integrase n=1 Tax=Halorubrum persicum TaxID=1383844 RepID=A0A2G1WLL8_9EURY|nr:site-specific integrase [Halorubrum persicum]PHQ39908.1 integrase [Halorubrum persicum]